MISPLRLDPPCRDGLALLLKARAYASDVHEDPWQFAVEMHRLEAAGMTVCDFRWLQCKGLIQHAVELPAPDKSLRRFDAPGGLSFEPASCLVLTRAGEEYARQMLGWQPAAASPRGWQQSEDCDPGGELNGEAALLKPTWDPIRQELMFNGVLIKQFKARADNQVLILCAFQEEQWPPRIDDPLPPQVDQCSKRRLHDTINALNRNQQRRLLRFSGDGTGMGVLWQIHEAHARQA